MPSDQPTPIFERSLIVRRRNRVASTAPEHDFLLSRVADDIAERLAFIQRTFPLAANLGAYHGTEIGYVFNEHEVWQPTDEVDERLTDIVMDYWVQFARTGNPNLPGRPEWPRYTAAEPRVMELGDDVRVIPPHDADFCLWLGPQK